MNLDILVTSEQTKSPMKANPAIVVAWVTGHHEVVLVPGAPKGLLDHMVDCGDLIEPPAPELGHLGHQLLVESIHLFREFSSYLFQREVLG